jgi:hypothetical protein
MIFESWVNASGTTYALTCSVVMLSLKPEVRSFWPMSKVYRAAEKSPSLGNNFSKTSPVPDFETLPHFNTHITKMMQVYVWFPKVNKENYWPFLLNIWDLLWKSENWTNWTSSEIGLYPLCDMVVFWGLIVDPAVAKLAPWPKFEPTESR